MSSITWRSRVLSGLFSFFIGHPSTLKMPQDFAYLPVDRALPPPGELSHERKVKRIYVDNVRRAVTQKVGVLMTVIALLITVVSFMVNKTIEGVGNLAHTSSSAASGWFHSKPSISSDDQQKVNQFLANASVPMCHNVSQNAQERQAQNPGQPLPPVLETLLQGCHDKFGNAIDN